MDEALNATALQNMAMGGSCEPSLLLALWNSNIVAKSEVAISSGEFTVELTGASCKKHHVKGK